ncbi:hypothetical protein QQ020_21570 [Fulvivirgaceae bacterium BMA12]|uniref:DUF5671 domain-containing protein n=1 Tax=Agaribacillus aureus TaxID=3051825 RepID=A0ABT8LEF9_9BACT|nr:hypothetical protein [Fulvivirgaceae bacterium BMA12]
MKTIATIWIGSFFIAILSVLIMVLVPNPYVYQNISHETLFHEVVLRILSIYAPYVSISACLFFIRTPDSKSKQMSKTMTLQKVIFAYTIFFNALVILIICIFIFSSNKDGQFLNNIELLSKVVTWFTLFMTGLFAGLINRYGSIPNQSEVN